MSFLLILSTMHVALTFYFYADKEYQGFMSEHRSYYFYLPISIILTCGFFTLALGDVGLVYLTIFYHAWLLFHYGRQNFGLMSFVCISQKALPLGKIERVAFQLAPIGAILGAHNVLPEFKKAVGFLAPVSWSIGLAIYMIAIVAFTYTFIFKRKGDSWLLRAYTAVLALFWAPTFLFTTYETAIMGYAVAHALQYFVFMYFCASGHKDGSKKGLILLGMGAVFGSVAIWLMRDKSLWGGPLLHFILGAGLGLVMWHFIVDAGLWKLRHKWQRERVKERFAFIMPPKR